MLFSHISDTHLGLVQYGSEERAQDMYTRGGPGPGYRDRAENR